MKEYEKLEMEVIVFEENDIITKSGPETPIIIDPND